MTKPPPQRPIEVTQADRDVAADYLYGVDQSQYPEHQRDMRNGDRDHAPTVRAFARHRLTASPQLSGDEVEKIADCLERVAEEHSGDFNDEDAEIVAAAIIALRLSPRMDDRDGVLREKAAAFIAKLDECQPYIDSAFRQMWNHGMDSGPQYTEELDALRDALKSEPSSLRGGV